MSIYNRLIEQSLVFGTYALVLFFVLISTAGAGDGVASTALFAPGDGDIQKLAFTQPILPIPSTQKLLIIPIDFKNSGSLESRPFTPEAASKVFFEGAIQQFFANQSYGKLAFEGKVLPWQRINRDGRAGTVCDYVRYDEIANIAKLSNETIVSYDAIVLLVYHPTMGGGCSSVGKWDFPFDGKMEHIGLAQIAAPVEWARELTPNYVVTHEMGHIVGLPHANGYDCGDVTLSSSCIDIEYGDYFDTMGRGEFARNYNSFYKEQLGWLTSSDVAHISNTGLYTIRNYSAQSGIRAGKISLAGNKAIYLEYRRGEGLDATLSGSFLGANERGLIMHYVDNAKYTSYLLDAVPTNDVWQKDVEEVSLQVGQSFTIPNTDTVITVRSAGTSEISFDVIFEKKIEPTPVAVFPLVAPVTVTIPTAPIQTFVSPITPVSPVIETVSTPVPPTENSSLIAHYTFDAISGSETSDSVSSIFASVKNASNREGKIGQALYFNGNSEVRLPAAIQAKFQNERSLSLWFKADTFGGYKTLFDDGKNGKSRDFSFWIDTASRGWVATGNTAGVAWNGSPISMNSWHHFVMTKDSKGEIKIYMDGKIYSTLKSGTNDTKSGIFSIGGNPSTGGSGWKGLIDDVKLYSNVLSATDIAGIMNDVPSATAPVVLTPEIKITEVVPTPVVSVFIPRTVVEQSIVSEVKPIVAEIVAPKTPTAPVAINYIKSNIQDANEDKAGVWYVFGKGSGKTNNYESRDWHWKLELGLASKKTIESIEVSNGNNEAWSASNVNKYPLVVYKDGNQLKNGYSLWSDKTKLGTYEVGAYTFDLYGQTESKKFTNGSVTIRLTDGTLLKNIVDGSLSF